MSNYKMPKSTKLLVARMKAQDAHAAGRYVEALIDAEANFQSFKKKPVNFMTTQLPPLKKGQEKYATY